MTTSLSEVGTTALVVAAARARESRRPDRLYDDPYAAAFVAAGGGEDAPWFPARLGPLDYLTIRTRFLDDFLIEATTACRQVVLLASGLDSRAFRLPWPAEVRLFELDRAELFQVKEPVLAEQRAAASCERVLVTADLTQDWATQLLAAGFRPEQPTAWLVEGVLIYLTEAEADHVLTQLSGLSAPGSRLAVEHVGRATLQHSPAMDTVGGSLSPLWQNTGTTDPEAWLATHARLSRVDDVADIADRYGRPVPPAFDPRRPRAARGGFLTARRRETYR